MTLIASLPYWLEWRLVVILFVGCFLFVVWKDNDGSLGIIPKSFYDFFKMLYNMLFRNIEDEEAYKENEAQRKADEAYKESLKKKKTSSGGKAGNENEEPKDKDKKEQDEDCDKPY